MWKFSVRLKSYRGRKPSGPVNLPSSVPVPESSGPPPSRPSPQPVHMLKPEQSSQQPMAPMPFYADPNRFTTPVWQADPTQGWPQGQFIQQIPAATQSTLEGYTQQYSNGIYQATYQQPAGFESNTFYTGAVQVLARPPSAPNQAQLTARPNGSYSHTPSPSAQSQQNNQRSNISGQYQQEYTTSNANYVAPATTPTGNADSSQSGTMSRPSSVNSVVNVSTNNQNFQNFTPISSSNFSPVSNATSSFVNSNMTTNSGNAMPGYPPVSSHPQLVSHNYSGGYPGNDLSGQGGTTTDSPHNDNNPHWSTNSETTIWDQSLIQDACNNQSAKAGQKDIEQFASVQNYNSQQSENKQEVIYAQSQNSVNEQQFSQADRIHLNSRLKTMILNKQQQQLESKLEESQKIEQNKTGHFLSYSHHRRPYKFGGGGGDHAYQFPSDIVPKKQINGMCYQNTPSSSSSSSQFKTNLNSPSQINSIIQELIVKNNHIEKKSRKPEKHYVSVIQSPNKTPNFKSNRILAEAVDSEKHRNVGLEIPPCNCIPSHQFSTEPGAYYTHLGCSDTIKNLRKDLEDRTGVNGKAIRIEKVCYTGKEGKTPQGCPIAKWIIRRGDYEEKYLIVAKQRPGHFCEAAIIVVCIVAWDGILQRDADVIYDMLRNKLNKFGLPTNRRCATNENRTCACQGLDPDRCGASFSFGCSWSMYYNGCKFARSKIVRKFRLSVKTEEDEIEDRLHSLATHLGPLYKTLAPVSFRNQCQHEQFASDCRLGFETGRPFSGVTACMDFCAHAHKDTHNMNNGCTVVVTLTKHRNLCKPEDEQLHVLPLYVIDSTDEFGSRKEQEEKVLNGSIEVLHKFRCEVRVRNVPKPTCRRTGKKRKEENQEKQKTKLDPSPPQLKTPSKQLQSNHVSSTVLDFSKRSPWGYESNLYYNPPAEGQSNPNGELSLHSNLSNSALQSNHMTTFTPSNDKDFINSCDTMLIQEQQDTALNLTYPFSNRDSMTPSSKTATIATPSYADLSTNIKQFQSTALKLNVNDSWKQYKHSNYNRTPIYNNSRKNLSKEFLSIDPTIKNVPVKEEKPDYFFASNQTLPSFKYIKSSFANYNVKGFSEPDLTASHVFIQNPFDDSDFLSNQNLQWCQSSSCYSPSAPTAGNWYSSPWLTEAPKVEKVLGEVADVIDNNESFRDSQVGGVAIALSHGSVLFECAKHELHATTALKSPNRESPTRISLVFYQHRNLNKAKHGWEEHEEKMRLRKLEMEKDAMVPLEVEDTFENRLLLRVPTVPIFSLTNSFPKIACVVSGAYQGV